MTDAHAAGILPCQNIEDLIAQEAITSQTPFDVDQVQPASLDLRLGARAWRVRASFLPGQPQGDRAAQGRRHARAGPDQGRGAGEGLRLYRRAAGAPEPCRPMSARGNPKSSTGRVDVFVRLLTDHSRAFDDVDAGYEGPLYMEIAPQTFSVLVRRARA
jgi:dCTP deaminase